jgi:hypothetical protein
MKTWWVLAHSNKTQRHSILMLISVSAYAHLTGIEASV